MLLERKIKIVNRLGLHARPATQFVETARRYSSTVQVRANGRDVDGRSVIGMLTLGAEEGTELLVVANGDDAAQALDALEKLVGGKFGEE